MWDPFKHTLQVFGQDNLIKADPEAVRKLKIPERSKKFMTDVGLPKATILLCEFDLNLEEFPTIQKYAEERGLRIKADLQLRRIGWDGGSQICLVETKNIGEVMTIDIEGRYPMRFVNSNIETFAGFLAIYVGEYCKFSKVPDVALDQKAFEIDARFHELDPAAFKNKETWWSSITEQMKCGML